ncbi:phospho-N-acetylmuramoyl-pentapeptide-transferase [Selenomonas sp. TAMA-11512]|uniref:phospho-N-acetylmuramoyl-pentapeptide- transferase n=1 Tax=Selenomonas sp. TAMA-11512 TaxID=3095337 RepID=UPI0030CCAD45
MFFNADVQSLVLAAAIAAGTVLAIGPVAIPKLHALKFGQSIREDGPKSHQAKSGTPTMGGILIVFGITLATFIAAPMTADVLLALGMLLGHYVLGFLDDYIKVVKKRNLGLRAKQKLLGQVVIALLVTYFSIEFLHMDTSLWLPFGLPAVSLGAGYYLFVICVLVGTSNAVNLTDGLDGLAAGTVTIAALAYTVIALGMGMEGLAIFGAATAAASFAFLRFNAHPAKIFMGDTGSLALGGAIAAMGILTHTELLLAVIGFVFVVEALSVILQVASFKSTGRRIFRMSPIHHHFELGGWSEWRVVLTFWACGLIAAAAGVWIYLA